MASNSITLIRADDATYDVTIVDEDGEVVDITGFTIKFTVRENPLDSIGVISKTTSSGISLTDPTNGVCRITITSADSTIDPGRYIYDVEVTNLSGKKTTVIIDSFIIKPDVSR